VQALSGPSARLATERRPTQHTRNEITARTLLRERRGFVVCSCCQGLLSRRKEKQRRRAKEQKKKTIEQGTPSPNKVRGSCTSCVPNNVFKIDHSTPHKFWERCEKKYTMARMSILQGTYSCLEADSIVTGKIGVRGHGTRRRDEEDREEPFSMKGYENGAQWSVAKVGGAVMRWI